MGSLPGALEMLMPYRFSNITALLLIPLSVTGIAWASGALAERQRGLVVLLVAGLAAVLGIRVMEDRGWVFRNTMFLIWGVFFAVDVYAHRQAPRRWLVSLLAAAAIVLITSIFFREWRREALFVPASFIPTLALLSASQRFTNQISFDRRWQPALALGLMCGCLMAGLGALRAASMWDQPNSVWDAVGQPAGRWESVTPYERSLSAWLAANVQPDAMVLPAVWPRSELQSKVGHPVLMESETLWLMTYVPRVAAATGMMTRDLFGVDYGGSEEIQQLGPNARLELYDPVWLKAWGSRSHDEWQALGKKYEFHLVLSPTGTRLDLPVALPGPVWTLYTIP
jgi:hypothetical protein